MVANRESENEAEVIKCECCRLKSGRFRYKVEALAGDWGWLIQVLSDMKHGFGSEVGKIWPRRQVATQQREVRVRSIENAQMSRRWLRRRRGRKMMKLQTCVTVDGRMSKLGQVPGQVPTSRQSRDGVHGRRSPLDQPSAPAFTWPMMHSPISLLQF